MGCTEERVSAAFEESELSYKEKSLFLYRFTSEVLDLHIRKYSSGNTISSRQMRHITDSLGIPGTKSNVASFYSSLLHEGGYLRRNFILICVLLGQGKDTEKADLIFEAFDDDASRCLELNEFENMWDCLVKNAVFHLPTLLISPSTATIEYLNHIKLSAEIAKAAVKEELLGDQPSISLIQFRHKIHIGRIKCILSPSGLRRMLYKYNKTEIPKTPIFLGRIDHKTNRRNH